MSDQVEVAEACGGWGGGDPLALSSRVSTWCSTFISVNVYMCVVLTLAKEMEVSY